MTKPGSALVRFSLQGLIIALLLAISAITFASDPVWVRIHHQVSDPAIASLARDAELADYGSFQWGQISAAEADLLMRQGVRLTTSANPFELTLGEDRFDPMLAGERIAAYQANPAGDWHLVQFDGPVRPEWLQSLRATGAQVAQPLHPFSYFIWANSGQISAARAIGAIRWTGVMQPNWKVQPHLRKFGSEMRPTMALASAHVDSNRLRSDLSQFGQVHKISPLNRHFQLVHMDVPGHLYNSVGELPAIYTVQYIRPETGPRGEMSNQSIVGNYDGSNAVFPGYASWLTDTGYNGTGVIVGVVDGGIRTSHVDLVDRMVPCVPSGDSPTSCTTNNNTHGTHVAGAVAGTGASGVTDGLGFLRGQGVAPDANIVQQRYNAFTGAGPGSMIPDGMLKIYRESALSGALLTNNSWGPTGSPQGYDIPTQQIDFISRDATPELPGHQPVLAVWSVMNGNGDSFGACSPSSLGSPDEAKNLFAVGSTSLQNTNGTQVANIFRVSPNSGHGPACDGRTVPHIVAPGCSTDSTSSGSNTAFGFACGTSMASPVVSGAVAVWAEKYIQQTSTNPSPALIKAVFTAAAQNLVGNPNADGATMGHRPDRFQGYGRLDLDLVMNHGLELYTLDQTEVFTSVGQDWSLGLNAVNPAEPIRIMLAWTDAPGHGLGGTTPAWVNDLDLAVDAGGNIYLGNVIGGDGWSASGGSPDDRNNLEGVFLSPAQHLGAVTVTVTASDLQGDALDPYNPTTNRQDFALACYNCIIGDPTFNINLAPSIGEACVPDSGDENIPVTVSVGTIGVYTGNVALSASGEPVGVSTLFDPKSVAAPGSSGLTITVDSTASAGSHPINVIGDDGDDIHSREFTLNLDEYLATGPALLAPLNGAMDTSLTPAFSWDALAGVNDYQIQLATDAAFTSIVIDASVEGASFTPVTELDTGTEYFWRVRGENFCGGGQWSSTFSFSTRLEPVASFSATELAFFINASETASANLVISNTGTGNLTFDIQPDQPDASGFGRDGHEPALDEELLLDPFHLPGNGSAPSQTVPGGLTSSGLVVGFTFEGTVSNITGTGGWASDLVMIITAPDGTAFSVGGFSTPHPDWDFQGSGSASDGTYTSVHIGPEIFGAEGVESAGDWQFAFSNTWSVPMDWSDVTITLHKDPLPVCGDELTNVNWLSVAPASGSIPQGGNEIVSVMVDSTGLIPNDYIGYLCVYTNDPVATMVPMSVELTVSGDAVPVANITPASFNFTVPVDNLDDDVLFIGNNGTATLTWDIHTAEAGTSGGIPYRSDNAEMVTGRDTVHNLPQGSSRAVGHIPSGLVDHYVPGANRGGPISSDWSESFEDIDVLPAAGWVIQNNSDPEGSTSWFQGDPASFEAHEGPTNSFAAANFNSTAGDGVISNWLLTPEIELHNDTEIRFWTRTTASIGFEDRMQVRLSTSGASADVGAAAADVGEFTELLLDINPTYAASGYPEVWTEYVLTIEGLAKATSGRIAFRYFVESGGPSGANSDYIGIDSFSVTQPVGPVPEGCDVPVTIGWLSVDQASGSTNPANVSEVAVQIDTNGLTEGNYYAVLCVATNDPEAVLVTVPVALDVVAQVAGVSLADTVQTYTGDQLEVTVITDPANLDVEVSYDGSPTPPTDADSYTVVVTITEEGWTGGTTGTFIIEPATASIMFDDLQQYYTGSQLEPTITTNPAGLIVTVTYDISPTAPSDVGQYLVEVEIDELNWTGSDSATFEILEPLPDEIFDDRFEGNGG